METSFFIYKFYKLATMYFWKFDWFYVNLCIRMKTLLSPKSCTFSYAFHFRFIDMKYSNHAQLQYSNLQIERNSIWIIIFLSIIKENHHHYTTSKQSRSKKSNFHYTYVVNKTIAPQLNTNHGPIRSFRPRDRQIAGQYLAAREIPAAGL